MLVNRSYIDKLLFIPSTSSANSTLSVLEIFHDIYLNLSSSKKKRHTTTTTAKLNPINAHEIATDIATIQISLMVFHLLCLYRRLELLYLSISSQKKYQIGNKNNITVSYLVGRGDVVLYIIYKFRFTAPKLRSSFLFDNLHMVLSRLSYFNYMEFSLYLL